MAHAVTVWPVILSFSPTVSEEDPTEQDVRHGSRESRSNPASPESCGKSTSHELPRSSRGLDDRIVLATTQLLWHHHGTASAVSRVNWTTAPNAAELLRITTEKAMSRSNQRTQPLTPKVMLWPRFKRKADEKLLLFEAAGGERLRLASNCPYEFYLDGQFVSDGGQRCPPGLVYVDEWDATRADRVMVRLHFMKSDATSVWFRCLFEDPFIADLTGLDWECYEDASVRFAAKVCSHVSEGDASAGVESRSYHSGVTADRHIVRPGLCDGAGGLAGQNGQPPFIHSNLSFGLLPGSP